MYINLEIRCDYHVIYRMELQQLLSYWYQRISLNEDQLFRFWILQTWQRLTANFLNPVFKTTELLTNGRQLCANRSWRTWFFGHEQFSHKQIGVRAANQSDLLIFNKYRSNGKSEFLVFLAGAIQVRTMMGCFEQWAKNCLDWKLWNSMVFG